MDARAAAHKVRRLKRKSADLEPSATITLTATSAAAAEVAPRWVALGTLGVNLNATLTLMYMNSSPLLLRSIAKCSLCEDVGTHRQAWVGNTLRRLLYIGQWRALAVHISQHTTSHALYWIT